ncbi:NACHT domain-containing protein [Sorangium sp. So ce260]|uniref:NACHT domain-containing protein n=1 Tax=Sorangium sp. So ce260 TaxID=3133291 RepID=UPI003F62C188
MTTRAIPIAYSLFRSDVMRLPDSELLDRITSARAANEPEVETKILLYIFELLGYTDRDRADKCSVRMHYGREKEDKKADFILYDGLERSAANALIAVETKAPSHALPDGEEQARSYATFAGTPFYIVCNGVELLAAQHIPGATKPRKIKISVRRIGERLEDLRAMLGRDQAVLAKERLEYLSVYAPPVENLPPGVFLEDYLSRLYGRFKNFVPVREPLEHTAADTYALPQIPVTVRLSSHGNAPDEMDAAALAERLAARRSRFLIFGDPGSGKTTLCQRVAHHLAKASLQPGAKLVPIYVDLRFDIPRTIAEAFFGACKSMRIPVFPAIYEKSLSSADVALILDGLDEVVDFDQAQNRIADMMSASPEASVLMTARTHLASRTGRLVSAGRLSPGKIKELSTAEIEEIFQVYLQDPAQSAAIFEAENRRGLPSLHSPMFVLMAIRVANQDRSWSATSTFSLYARYVGTLHEYFNVADATNGAVKPEHVLDVLSDASTTLATAMVQRRSMSLEELVERLKTNRRVRAVPCLLRTGLLSSSAGRAVFLHKSFFDFGLARTILSDLRAGRHSEPAVVAVATENVYLLIRSEMSDAEEERFRAVLSAADTWTKKRLLGIFRCKCSKETLDVIWECFQKGGNLTVWTGMLRALLSNQDPRIEPWLNENASKLPKRKLAKAGFWLNELGAPESALTALAISEARFDSWMVRAAFDRAFKHDRRELVADLVARYRSSKPRWRNKLIGVMGRHKVEPMAMHVLEEAALAENTPRLSLRLLGIFASLGVQPRPEIVDHWTKVLNAPDGYWHPKELWTLTKLREKLLRARPEEARFAPLTSVLDKQMRGGTER